MPALIQLLGALPGGGFSTNAITSPSARVGTTPNARRILDLRERDRRLRAALVVEAHHRAEVEVGEHVAVADDEPLVDPFGREPDRAGGAERLVLDGVADLDVAEDVLAGAVVREVRVERVRQVAHREHDLVDAVPGEPPELALEERLVRDRAAAASAW